MFIYVYIYMCVFYIYIHIHTIHRLSKMNKCIGRVCLSRANKTMCSEAAKERDSS